MATSSIVKDRRADWIAIVERHIRLENAHDLEGLLDTFGDNARYDDEPWEEHHTSRNGVRAFYEQLMKALPDLEIEVQACGRRGHRCRSYDSRNASWWVARVAGDSAASRVSALRCLHLRRG